MLFGVSCTSAKSCLAVGAAGSSSTGLRTAAVTYNGKTWVRQTVLPPARQRRFGLLRRRLLPDPEGLLRRRTDRADAVLLRDPDFRFLEREIMAGRLAAPAAEGDRLGQVAGDDVREGAGQVAAV
ncbi:MAG: hypothetical protein JWM19_4560 [Actinomycetia bacterium]|nr:hypothetical protein [Actinomycetes bacterium]